MGQTKAKASQGSKWITTDGRVPMIPKTPLEMSMLAAAAKRAVVGAATAMTPKQHLAQREEQVAVAAQRPAVPLSGYSDYLRFGPSTLLGTSG
jgi:hypothetical protein